MIGGKEGLKKSCCYSLCCFYSQSIDISCWSYLARKLRARVAIRVLFDSTIIDSIKSGFNFSKPCGLLMISAHVSTFFHSEKFLVPFKKNPIFQYDVCTGVRIRKLCKAVVLQDRLLYAVQFLQSLLLLPMVPKFTLFRSMYIHYIVFI